MPFIIDSTIGARMDEVDTVAKQTIGTVKTANDGHDYIYAKASAAIAGAAVCVLTEPAMTMATGAGAWTAPATAVPINNFAWFKKTVL